jgi:hypothetical protein
VKALIASVVMAETPKPPAQGVASPPAHPTPKPPGFDASASKTPQVTVPPKSRAELRRLFLEQSAITLGQSWADQWRDDLRREGRPAAGGWPGTLREARVRVEHHLLAEVTRRKMPAVTEAEREVAARKAYASARAQWCRQAEPEAP